MNLMIKAIADESVTEIINETREFG